MDSQIIVELISCQIQMNANRFKSAFPKMKCVWERGENTKENDNDKRSTLL